jgi:hypothetical protein
MKMIKYPSIEQFRNVVSNIKKASKYVGYDEEKNEAIMDYNLPDPVVTFKGSVKLHGTNAGISLDVDTGEVWAQSRGNIITPEKDNAGFAFFMESNKEHFLKLFEQVKSWSSNEYHGCYISLFGEWAGKGVQGKVAIAELEKQLYIFGIKISPKSEDPAFWLDVSKLDVSEVEQHKIYNIENFPTWEMAIDFSCPEKFVNDLADLTKKIGDECPVAKHFDVSGVGEGIVWKGRYKDNMYFFKVKDERHQSSKIKKLVKVDIEKLKSVEEFVEYAVTDSRCEQGLKEVFGDDEIDIKKMGEYLRWIMGDIVKEELDTLKGNGLEPKDVGKYVSIKARKFFLDKYNNF